MRLTLIAAQSVDGFITRHDTPGSAFASDADRAFFREALTQFDCCVMGGQTYREAREAIRRNLMPGRLRLVVTRNPAAFREDASGGSLEFTDLAPGTLVTNLESRGFKRGALLGGAQMHSLFLNAGLVEELWLTVEPLLFGNGTPLLAGRTDIQLRLLETRRLAGSTLLNKYSVCTREK